MCGWVKCRHVVAKCATRRQRGMCDTGRWRTVNRTFGKINIKKCTSCSHSLTRGVPNFWNPSKHVEVGGRASQARTVAVHRNRVFTMPTARRTKMHAPRPNGGKTVLKIWHNLKFDRMINQKNKNEEIIRVWWRGRANKENGCKNADSFTMQGRLPERAATTKRNLCQPV